jgi:hypothetical protein
MVIIELHSFLNSLILNHCLAVTPPSDTKEVQDALHMRLAELLALCAHALVQRKIKVVILLCLSGCD